MLVSGSIPDRDDECILRVYVIAVAPSSGCRAVGGPHVEGNLRKLGVERFGDFVAVEPIGGQSGEGTDRGQEADQPHQKPATQRGHRMSPGIVQPIPRTLRTMSLSNFFRT